MSGLTSLVAIDFRKVNSIWFKPIERLTTRLENGMCSPTKRLSDAGDDLVYLHFVKHERNAARIYGFVTSRPTDLETAQLWDRVTSPLSDLVVQLHSEGRVRYAHTDGSGRYVLDGLEEGKHRLTVFHRDYPENTKVLAGPRDVHVKASGCVASYLLLKSRVLVNESLAISL